jgi:hypothetical protein
VFVADSAVSPEVGVLIVTLIDQRQGCDYDGSLAVLSNAGTSAPYFSQLVGAPFPDDCFVSELHLDRWTAEETQVLSYGESGLSWYTWNQASLTLSEQPVAEWVREYGVGRAISRLGAPALVVGEGILEDGTIFTDVGVWSWEGDPVQDTPCPPSAEPNGHEPTSGYEPASKGVCGGCVQGVPGVGVTSAILALFLVRRRSARAL